MGAQFGLLGVVGATIAAVLMLAKLAIAVSGDALQLLDMWRGRKR